MDPRSFILPERRIKEKEKKRMGGTEGQNSHFSVAAAAR
jgi:hypothetical protein